MFSFLNPMFLWALGAALVPLILHMMQRRRIITLPFSTVRFLKLAQKKSANRIRMENILLWFLRTLLMVLIALAFAAPVLKTSSFGSFLSTSRRDVAIVWDASYSMGYVSGRRNIWEESKKAVVAAIESLRPGDRAALFLADDYGTALIEQPTSDRQLVIDTVKAQKPRYSSSRLLPAVQAARDALAGEERREKEIFIITDGQSLPWTDFRHAAAEAAESPPPAPDAGQATNAPGLPLAPVPNPPATNRPFKDSGSRKTARAGKDITYFAALLGVSSPENTAPIGVEIQPSVLMAETPAMLLVKTIRSGPALNGSITLFVDENEISRRALVQQANSQAETVFHLPALKPGIHTARIETAPDGLELDNAFHLLLRVHDNLPVLCAGLEEESFFLMKALNPTEKTAAIAARRIDPGQLAGEQKLSDYSAIFLCNALPMAGESIVPIEQYVRKGGLLAVFPGDRAGLNDYAAMACLPGMPSALRELRGAEGRQMLRLAKSGDPLFRGMKLPPGIIPTVAVNRMLAWDKLAPQSETIVDSDRGMPFLLRRQFGKGYVLFFAVSADRRWSNFPLSSFFLPIVHQVVRFGSNAEISSPFFWSSRNMVVSDFPNVGPETSSMLDPAGAELPVVKIKAEGGMILSLKEAEAPGVYRAPPDKAPVFAVNVPRAESDLTRVDAESIPKLIGTRKAFVANSQEELDRLVSEHRLGKPVAEQLLWLAFLVGIAEFFIANRASRKGLALSQQLQVESSGRVKGKASA